LFFENRALFRYFGKQCTAEQGRDENVTHANCILDT